MTFPITRMRRLRMNPLVRELVAETGVTAADLVMPLFVCTGADKRVPIESMPGNCRLSIDLLVGECKKIAHAGIRAVLLFGIPDKKDETGDIGADDNGIVQQAVRAIKKSGIDLLVITDVCNCEYTTHGHCGPLKNGEIDNDHALKVLAKQALSHARAGSDIIAPSDMMDGRVAAIREALDDEGYHNLPIMAYSAKYASAFYGPFREAAGCAPKSGDRKTYQMDPANSNEALREVELDLAEGADIIMIKPALGYLDIVRRVHDTFKVPLAAFNVSGEFSMVKAAGAKGWINEECLIMEILTSIKRAGADIIITYHALEAATIIKKAGR